MYKDIRAEKQAARKRCISLRDSLPADIREKNSMTICERIRGLITYRQSDIILVYHSIKSEVSTLPLISFALQDGKKVALPRCGDERQMSFGYIESTDELSPGKFHIPEPPAENRTFTAQDGPSICVVPALAFDKKGFRLGYGGGYYDNFLRNYNGSKIGVAFYGAVLDNVPHGKYDSSVDVIITERKVFAANG